jgi:signal transduction histidine kinase
VIKPTKHLRRRAFRVALISTAAVFGLMVVVLAVTDVVVSRNLTAGIDDHLRDRMNRPLLPIQRSLSSETTDGDFDEPVLEWLVTPQRIVQTDPTVPALPGNLQNVTDAQTESFAGGSFRFAGTTQADGDHLVVAASLYPVTHAVDTLLVTEALATPALLLLVLAGTFLVGQRVADPIERMRQRQLAFTADASHELRTPLAVIRAETSLARHGTPEEAKKALAKVESEADRMRRIVDDLLWLARFQVEPQRHDGVPVDITTLAAVGVERFKAVAERRSITLEADVADEQAVRVIAPPDWIDHALGILVDNACRYSPVGGHVIVAVRADAGRAELSVTDSGPGVPEDDVEHLFDRYRRGTEVGEGAGLGLAIADAIVRATGGQWSVNNQPAGGARFAISWPAAQNG